MGRNVVAVVHLAAESRDSHLTLRRVERQQRLVELLGAVREPVSSAVLARQLGVGLRTVERDLARLRESGVPIESLPGPSGGHRLPRGAAPNPVSLTFEEVAALIASLAALGPTSTHSSDSAMRALVQAIAPDVAEAGEDRQPDRHVLKTTSDSLTPDRRKVTDRFRRAEGAVDGSAGQPAYSWEDGEVASYVAFLRGVNLGPSNKISMPALRAMAEDLGYTGVATYINSGNLIIKSAKKAAAVEREIANAIKQSFGRPIDVTVRTSAQLEKILAENPYPDGNPSQVTVAFLTKMPAMDAEDKVAAVAADYEPFTFAGQQVYVNYSHGLGRSKLAERFSDIIGVSSTVRNIRTVEKVLALCGN